MCHNVNLLKPSVSSYFRHSSNIISANRQILTIHQRGQGLIEALMIAVFVGVNVMALISLQNYLTYTTSLAQQQSNANLLAESEIELLRDFGVLNTTSGYTAYQQIVTNSSSSTLGNTTYTLNWTVTPASGLAYVTVSVSVSWTDRRGLAQSARLITNIAGVDPALPASYL
jgi:Tfp pilus assembly protein PilV